MCLKFKVVGESVSFKNFMAVSKSASLGVEKDFDFKRVILAVRAFFISLKLLLNLSMVNYKVKTC